MCDLCTPASEPSSFCGSLRIHDEHDWVGQTTLKELHCPGIQRGGPHAVGWMPGRVRLGTDHGDEPSEHREHPGD